MKAIILGYGKMGHLIEEILLNDSRNSIIAILDKEVNKQNTLIYNDITEIPNKIIDDSDIIFDFVGANSQEILKYLLLNFKKLKIISGSTAWNPETLYDLIKKNEHSFLYSANFSVGINIFKILLNYLLQNTKIRDFDASLLEYHHKNKKDAPSGTALALKELFTKNNIELPILSIRQGAYPGIHQIDFDTNYETISINHTARSRKVFAEGAVYAGKYLLLKESGIYSFEDVLNNKTKK